MTDHLSPDASARADAPLCSAQQATGGQPSSPPT